MKKFLSGLLILAIVVCLVPVHAEGADKDKLKRGRAVLLNSGWTDEEIDDLLDEKAIAVYDGAELVSSQERYYKVSESEENSGKDSKVVELTKEQCLSQCELLGVNELVDDDIHETYDGYLKYTLTAHYIGDEKYVLLARYQWLKTPYFRNTDIFSLSYDTNLTMLGDEPLNYAYKADMFHTWKDERYTHVERQPTELFKDAGGVVVKQDLMNDMNANPDLLVEMKAYNHRGYLQYTVGLNKADVKRLAAFADYRHLQTNYGISAGVSIPEGGSLSVTPSDYYKRMSPNARIDFVNRNDKNR